MRNELRTSRSLVEDSSPHCWTFECRTGGGLLDSVFRHQTGWPGCQDLVQALDDSEVHLPQAALPYRHRSPLCRSRLAEGLPSDQFNGILSALSTFPHPVECKLRVGSSSMMTLLSRCSKTKSLIPSTFSICLGRGWSRCAFSPGTFSVSLPREKWPNGILAHSSCKWDTHEVWSQEVALHSSEPTCAFCVLCSRYLRYSTALYFYVYTAAHLTASTAYLDHVKYSFVNTCICSAAAPCWRNYNLPLLDSFPHCRSPNLGVCGKGEPPLQKHFSDSYWTAGDQ